MGHAFKGLGLILEDHGWHVNKLGVVKGAHVVPEGGPMAPKRPFH